MVNLKAIILDLTDFIVRLSASFFALVSDFDVAAVAQVSESFVVSHALSVADCGGGVQFCDFESLQNHERVCVPGAGTSHEVGSRILQSCIQFSKVNNNK